MEEQSAESFIDIPDARIESMRNAQWGTMTFTIPDNSSRFTVDCFECNHSFRDYITKGNIEKYS